MATVDGVRVVYCGPCKVFRHVHHTHSFGLILTLLCGHSRLAPDVVKLYRDHNPRLTQHWFPLVYIQN